MRLLLSLLFLSSMCVAHPGHDHESENTIQIVTWQDAQSIIDRVKATPKRFSRAAGQAVNISYRIKQGAEVHIDIFDENGNEVACIDKEVKAGEHTVVWDGMNNSKPVCGKVFLYVIKAFTEDGKAYFYNPAQITGGIQVKPLEYTLDREKGKFEFVLPQTCKVQIRAGIAHGMYVEPVIDWEPFLPGRHSILWDGKDQTGMLNLLKRKDVELMMSCYTLPDNTVIVEDPEEFIANESKNAAVRDAVWATAGKYYHYGHLPEVCREPEFTIEVLNNINGSANSSEIPKVSGELPLRIQISRKDEKRLIDTRFEIQIYMDGVFVYETEDAMTPFNLHIDTKSFLPGKHVLTVNVLAYDDHYGSLSKIIEIGE